jgi:translation initiation factor 2B subunit (eIF-2B alpha/beta/delta family)
MGTLIVQPDTKEKLDALKAFLKALKISFEETKSPYNAEFVSKIKQGEEDIEAGRTKKISLDDVCENPENGRGESPNQIG